MNPSQSTNAVIRVADIAEAQFSSQTQPQPGLLRLLLDAWQHRDVKRCDVGVRSGAIA